MPTLSINLPELYPKQYEAVMDTARITVTFASTKAGKSVGYLTWILAKALSEGRPGYNYHWVSPTYAGSKIMYRRLSQWLTEAGLSRNFWNSNESELFISFNNGARIYFKGADRPDSLYGDDSYGVVIDEGSRCKEEAYHACRSLVTHTKAQIKIPGNMRGKGNWMYKLWLQGHGTNPNISSHILTCYDAIAGGVLDAEEIEAAKLELPPEVFSELYECKPQDNGSNPFGIDNIDACITQLSDLPAVVYGIDLAKSFDYTVIIGLDSEGNVCSFDRWQGFDWSSQVDLILDTIGNTHTILDATGAGSVVVDNLQARAYERNLSIDIEPFVFTGSSKQPLMVGLSSAIRRHIVGYPEGLITEELNNFEFEYTSSGGVKYSAPSGYHDDCVCSLALAVKGFTVPSVEPNCRGFF